MGAVRQQLLRPKNEKAKKDRHVAVAVGEFEILKI